MFLPIMSLESLLYAVAGQPNTYIVSMPTHLVNADPAAGIQEVVHISAALCHGKLRLQTDQTLFNQQ